MTSIAALIPRLGSSVGRFDTGDFPQDRFLWASGEAALRLEVTRALRVAASYRAELRSYPDRPGGDERDLVHIGQVRLGYRPGPRFERAAVVRPKGRREMSRPARPSTSSPAWPTRER